MRAAIPNNQQKLDRVRGGSAKRAMNPWYKTRVLIDRTCRTPPKYSNGMCMR